MEAKKSQDETILVPLQGLGVIVIADDITGAAEIAGVCLRYGLKVSFGIDSVPNENTDVRIIATDSRSMSELEAYQIHQKIAVELYKDSNPFVFKKCDSVLRGYVLTELSAIMDVSKTKTVLLQPANPVVGRYIKNGIYYIGDKKIQDTGFSVDPDFPATESMVQEILFQRSTTHNSIDEVHLEGVTNINGFGAFIPDCSSIEELASCCELAYDNTLLCGGAAFFEQILIKKGLKMVEKNKVQSTLPDEFLLVSGSTHTESRLFVEKMREYNFPVVAFPETLLQEKVENDLIIQWANKLAADWQEKRMLILTVSETNITFTNSSTVLKQRLEVIVRKILEQCNVTELLIEGGATTYSLLKALGWKTLTPVEELVSGVVRMKVQDYPANLTLKPGSYNWPSAYLNH